MTKSRMGTWATSTQCVLAQTTCSFLDISCSQSLKSGDVIICFEFHDNQNKS